MYSILAILMFFIIAVHSDTLPQSTIINLLVIGSNNRTILRGIVPTTGHNITTPSSGGSHHCDGTNNNTNPIPGPTMISALDDAASFKGVKWDANFSKISDDFIITSIDGDNVTDNEVWVTFLNSRPVNGGCRLELKNNDSVTFLYGSIGV
ncbi:hypothetical protein BDQ17DRAFT_1365299 [Cyathus striatus]|nr:hypothetical protein BDQ17DRAFT_1365299 [Cyathus striatus]